VHLNLRISGAPRDAARFAGPLFLGRRKLQGLSLIPFQAGSMTKPPCLKVREVDFFRLPGAAQAFAGTISVQEEEDRNRRADPEQRRETSRFRGTIQRAGGSN
jgi:hypothetical protein